MNHNFNALGSLADQCHNCGLSFAEAQFDSSKFSGNTHGLVWKPVACAGTIDQHRNFVVSMQWRDFWDEVQRRDNAARERKAVAA